MKKDFEIISIEKCWYSPFHVYAIFHCLKDCRTKWETLMGNRMFEAYEGQCFRIRINKNYCPYLGRKVNIDYLLPEAFYQNKIIYSVE